MGFATADLTIHYFKRARTDVTARARVVKKGKRINVGTIDLYDDGGDLVATVLTSFLLSSPADPTEGEL
jgi:acyl-coenzyme A thioesterase PaaI-like protein